jgi:hypothetical protein
MAKMTMGKAMKMVEKSREDKARDKKMGYKEGSKADMKLDKMQAKRMMGKKK